MHSSLKFFCSVEYSVSTVHYLQKRMTGERSSDVSMNQLDVDMMSIYLAFFTGVCILSINVLFYIFLAGWLRNSCFGNLRKIFYLLLFCYFASEIKIFFNEAFSLRCFTRQVCCERKDYNVSKPLDNVMLCDHKWFKSEDRAFVRV